MSIINANNSCKSQGRTKSLPCEGRRRNEGTINEYG
jgi:hypothetical protein